MTAGQNLGEFQAELGEGREVNVLNAVMLGMTYYFCALRHSSFHRYVNQNRLQNHEPPNRVTVGQPFQHSFLLAFTCKRSSGRQVNASDLPCSFVSGAAGSVDARIHAS